MRKNNLQLTTEVEMTNSKILDFWFLTHFALLTKICVLHTCLCLSNRVFLTSSHFMYQQIIRTAGKGITFNFFSNYGNFFVDIVVKVYCLTF